MPVTTSRRRALYLALGLAAALPCAAGPLYKTVGPDGKITFSDIPPAAGTTQPVRAGGSSPGAVDESDPTTASMKVASLEVIVKSTYDFCQRHAPATAPAVAEARDAWLRRNAELASRKVEILHDRLSDTQLHQFSAGMTQENLHALGLMSQAPAADQLKWCQDAPGKFVAYEINPVDHPALVAAILGYKPRH
ncbi:MAG: hypothetical protein P4L83_00285 [Nevskia sp.]|nr:hypothetical protein [Nevskia sp.]